MISHTITNLIPSWNDGRLFSLAFTVVAVDGDLHADLTFNTPASLPEREEAYAEADFMLLAGEIAMRTGLYTQLNDKLKAMKAELAPPDVKPVPMDTDPVKQRAAWVKHVDDMIADIITKSTRFQMGYVEREAAAISFKAAGYKGDPTIWISRFADNIKIPYRAAADLILSQAAQLRKALMNLEALRMDKYLVASAKSHELAEAEFNRIVRGANDIASKL